MKQDITQKGGEYCETQIYTGNREFDKIKKQNYDECIARNDAERQNRIADRYSEDQLEREKREKERKQRKQLAQEQAAVERARKQRQAKQAEEETARKQRKAKQEAQNIRGPPGDREDDVCEAGARHGLCPPDELYQPGRCL